MTSPAITKQTIAGITKMIQHTGRVPQDDVMGWGYRLNEIDAAIAQGKIRRHGCIMGATTIMYLSPVTP